MKVRVDVTHDHCESRTTDRANQTATIIAPSWTAKFPQNSIELGAAFGNEAIAEWTSREAVRA